MYPAVYADFVVEYFAAKGINYDDIADGRIRMYVDLVGDSVSLQMIREGAVQITTNSKSFFKFLNDKTPLIST